MNSRLISGLLTAGLALGAAVIPSAESSPRLMGKHLVFQLKGTAVAAPTMIDTDGDGMGDTMADCYTVDLFDPATGVKVGQAVDCLSDVNVVMDDDPANMPLGFNLALTGTTFFVLPQGTLVTQGLTTVRPVLQPTTRDGITFTHITGANGDGGVQYGTRRFHRASGKVRLSGLVNLARLISDGEITFDCLFVIDLD